MKKPKTITQQLKELHTAVLLIDFILLAMLGGVLNSFAVAINDGRMPVKGYYYSTDTHFGYNDTSEVNRWILTDIIDLKLIILSIGDVFIFVGVIGIITLTTRSIVNYYRKKMGNIK